MSNEQQPGGYLAVALFYIIPFRRIGRINLFRRPRPARRPGTEHEGEG